MAASILWGMPCRLSQVCSSLSEQLFIEYCCLSASTPQRGGMLHLGVKTLAQTTAVHTCCLLALANGGALMLLGERWSFCTKPNKRHVMDSTLHSTAACKGAGGARHRLFCVVAKTATCWWDQQCTWALFIRAWQIFCTCQVVAACSKLVRISNH